ncbi:hypothetical protein [Vulcanisaeta souniana]|nr:hypothetical protein [Vulcanisaeta souniana]
MSVDEMRNTTKGKVIKVIHHLNDKLWSLAKELIKQ